MPYRRLPNTDSARHKALSTALRKGNELPPFKVALTQATLQRVRYFLPLFEKALLEQKHAFNTQVLKNKEYLNVMKKARIYISHFIQVLNFSIARNEIPSNARKYYGMSEDIRKVPTLSTEPELISFGEKIIKGEQERIAKGGNPITNPTIAVVRVRYEKFMDAYRFQKTLQENTNRALGKVAELRNEADSIILNIWNEAEDFFNNMPDDLKRENASQYGVSYVFRRTEKEKSNSETDDNSNGQYEIDTTQNTTTVETVQDVVPQAEPEMHKEKMMASETERVNPASYFLSFL